MDATSYQPLLERSKKLRLRCRAFYSVLALIAVVSSAVFLLPGLLKTRFSHPSVAQHICDQALDPEECLALLVSDVASDRVTQSDGIALLQKFLIKYVHHMDGAVVDINGIRHRINDHYEQGALADCLELLDISIDLVTESVAALGNRTSLSHATAQSWLSAVLTNHVTCLDGLNMEAKSLMGTLPEGFISRARASLAMLAADRDPNEDFYELKQKMPSWISLRDRKLLESSAKEIKADVVVTQDGTGNYTKLADAVAAAPDKSKNRYVIYVKQGTYKENVKVTKKKMNLMIVGDGMNSTIITGSLNVIDGSTTFKSATLAAVGEGIILQDLWIQNTAGPEKHQAVALRVGADKSVINRCQIDAYQDTLYAHSLRQFYRDCYVTGTVDFIFGNAAVVFQNCKLVARRPMKNQKNMVTAQGRTDPNQSTGTSIQNCEIIASPDLKPVKNSFPTYLGRPWKEYSRTVVMESYIEDHIDPAGWAEWSGDFALKTLYYGEYMNRGPGAGTSKRVN